MSKICDKASQLEQTAIGLATAQFVSCDNEDRTFYQCYLEIVEHNVNNDEPNCCVICEAYEYWDWHSVIEQIDSLANDILAILKKSLEFCKAGIVYMTTHCELEGDMNLLDMEAMFDKGLLLE